MLPSNIGDEIAGWVHSRKHEVAINWYSLLVSLTGLSWIIFYISNRLTQCSFCCCLVSAVHGAHRRVHEELEPCSTAVKILQDVFGELPKNTECEDGTYNTEIERSELAYSTLRE